MSQLDLYRGTDGLDQTLSGSYPLNVGCHGSVRHVMDALQVVYQFPDDTRWGLMLCNDFSSLTAFLVRPVAEPDFGIYLSMYAFVIRKWLQSRATPLVLDENCPPVPSVKTTIRN